MPFVYVGVKARVPSYVSREILLLMHSLLVILLFQTVIRRLYRLLFTSTSILVK